MHDWLDRDAYPFSSHSFALPMGRMHYVDEGDGEHAVVMLHGNPAWSFAYRRLIRCLSARYRCIAPDYIGFGLSDKPPAWDYLPKSHAQNLERLLDHLGVASATLIVNDWGGPIGLSWALNHPQKVKSLVILNTWMWSVKGVMHYEMFSRLMGGPVGRALIKRYNVFVTVLMKQMFQARLAPSIHRHYVEPLREPDARKGCWTFPREIIGSSEWLDGLWRRRQAIADKPALVLWGRKDIAFRDVELRRWKGLLTAAEVYEYDDAGHFVQEALGDALCPLIERHLRAALGEQQPPTP